MQNFILTLTVLSFLGLASHTKAEPIFLGRDINSGLVAYGYLAIDDQVSGKCWTNSTSIASRARLTLEQSGIAILNEVPAYYGPHTVYIELTTIGFRTQSGICAASAEFSVKSSMYEDLFYNKEVVATVSYGATLYSSTYVATNSSNNNEQLSEFFTGEVANFASNVLSARRNEKILQYFETVGRPSEPISLSEFNQRLEAK